MAIFWIFSGYCVGRIWDVRTVVSRTVLGCLSNGFLPRLKSWGSSSYYCEIWKEPLDHEEELEMEGATIYDFDGGRGEDDWHNTNKSKDEIEKICKRNDAGALIMKPCVHTNYIEFRLEPPSGFAKECTCNECWNKFWIAPFSEPAECPYCHVRGINIASREYVGDGES